ncbi:MAG: hypothetical protein AAGB24_11490 [Bacteroidota bacterium]
MIPFFIGINKSIPQYQMVPVLFRMLIDEQAINGKQQSSDDKDGIPQSILYSVSIGTIL